MTAPHVLRCFTHNGLMLSCSGSLEFLGLLILEAKPLSRLLSLFYDLCYGLASTQIIKDWVFRLGFFPLLFVSFSY